MHVLYCSEFIAKKSNDDFWRFVDKLDSPKYEDVLQSEKLFLSFKRNLSSGGRNCFSIICLFSVTDKTLYENALEDAGAILTPFDVKLLKFSLSLRANSPTVEMYNQVKSDLC